VNEPVKEPLGPTARRAGTILARTRLIQEGALAPTTIQQPAEAEVIGAPVEVLGAVVARSLIASNEMEQSLCE